VCGEDTVHVAHFVDDKNSEGDAEQPGGDGQAAIEADETHLRIFEWERDGGGDEHHAGDGADAEDEEVSDGPAGVTNGGQNEKSDGGGAGKPMDQANGERAHGLIQAELAEGAIHPSDRCGVFVVTVLFGFVMMPMGVNVITVLVRMSVLGAGGGIERGGRKCFSEPAGEASEIQDAEQDEHEADG